MQNLFKKFNSKIVIIGIVSAIVVILCVVGIVTGVNSKNTKESNKTKNDKKVELETSSIKETQTNRNIEESMDTALSTENMTEESDTEESSENVTEEAEENNVQQVRIMAAIHRRNIMSRLQKHLPHHLLSHLRNRRQVHHQNQVRSLILLRKIILYINQMVLLI